MTTIPEIPRLEFEAYAWDADDGPGIFEFSEILRLGGKGYTYLRELNTVASGGAGIIVSNRQVSNEEEIFMAKKYDFWKSTYGVGEETGETPEIKKAVTQWEHEMRKMGFIK